jgi:hypothetical protein
MPQANFKHVVSYSEVHYCSHCVPAYYLWTHTQYTRIVSGDSDITVFRTRSVFHNLSLI